MPETQSEKTILGFYSYPPVGTDDWRYAYETAQVRALETQMLSRTTLMDMANAPDFASAVSSLSVTEYALSGGAGPAAVETALIQRRAAVWELFEDWMHDERTVTLFRSRRDFANLRLVLRRRLTDQPVGADYSDGGNVPPEQFAPVFEEESYELLPDFVRDATEQAVLAYYQDRDIRQIDHALARAQVDYQLRAAARIGSVFLLGLFRIQIDLTNLRTLLRLKFTEAAQRNVFLDGGFVELERFRHALDLGYESLGSLFFVTPYHRIVDVGANYLASNQSFLKIEQQCDEHVAGFLRSTVVITAGPQPIIAFLLMKEQEIRTVRLILTAKRNHLDTRLILDRIS